MIKDVNGFIERINAGGQDFGFTMGSGGTREIPGNITTDLLDHENVDICGDIFEVLASLKDNSISSFYASHFIEHIPNLDLLLNEIVRVSRNGAKIQFIAPHFSNAFFYSDVTHCKFFGLYTFCYLAEDRTGLWRKTPNYAQISQLALLDVKLIFRSYRPFYLRHAFRKAIGLVVGICSYTKELYEECWTGIVSCYEVKYILTVEKQ
jgi:ubiquinone/menaquinone biosynthesis C-methylase UbiE